MIPDYAEDDTKIPIRFNTVDGNGAPVAPSSAFTTADVSIYKDDSATQKTSANGLTMASPFDSTVGRHHLIIDSSNDTGDAGFWQTGSSYVVELNTAKTVDGQSVDGLIIGEFTIEKQYMRGTNSSLLAASAPSNFSSLLINSSGHVTRVTTVDTTTANTDMRGTDSAFLAASAPANFSSFLINASGHVTRVTTVDTTTANTDMRGTDSAYTGTPPTAVQIRQEMDSNSTQLALIVDGQGYGLTILAGAISNAGNAAEAYTFTYNGTDYAATYAGLDASGNRGTTVLSKP